MDRRYGRPLDRYTLTTQTKPLVAKPSRSNARVGLQSKTIDSESIRKLESVTKILQPQPKQSQSTPQTIQEDKSRIAGNHFNSEIVLDKDAKSVVQPNFQAPQRILHQSARVYQTEYQRQFVDWRKIQTGAVSATEPKAFDRKQDPSPDALRPDSVQKHRTKAGAIANNEQPNSNANSTGMSRSVRDFQQTNTENVRAGREKQISDSGREREGDEDGLGRRILRFDVDPPAPWNFGPEMMERRMRRASYANAVAA
ncbi:hypothetical protein HDU84_005710 [Entophlyctis sp. JEL0112]|nr:hypothetical protein HDU84_005710 [Entophlyctis sp. JEL0112]